MDWDVNLLLAINGWAGRWLWLDDSFSAISRPAYVAVPAVLGFAYWFWKNRRQALVGAVVLGCLIGSADFLGMQLKRIVDRPRPCWALSEVYVARGCGRAPSFPSNHAVNSAAAATFFQLLFPATGWISWPLVGIIGLSRVFIGAHYPTDVFGGWILGGIVAWIFMAMVGRWFPRAGPARQ